jgi:hypothetical protein
MLLAICFSATPSEEDQSGHTHAATTLPPCKSISMDLSILSHGTPVEPLYGLYGGLCAWLGLPFDPLPSLAKSLLFPNSNQSRSLCPRTGPTPPGVVWLHKVTAPQHIIGGHLGFFRSCPPVLMLYKYKCTLLVNCS